MTVVEHKGEIVGGRASLLRREGVKFLVVIADIFIYPFSTVPTLAPKAISGPEVAAFGRVWSWSVMQMLPRRVQNSMGAWSTAKCMSPSV